MLTSKTKGYKAIIAHFFFQKRLDKMLCVSILEIEFAFAKVNYFANQICTKFSRIQYSERKLKPLIAYLFHDLYLI